MSCLWCNQEIIQEISWKNVFKWEERLLLCTECFSSLEVVSEHRCRRCSRSTTGGECKDCIWWKHYSRFNDPLTFNVSIFVYNELMQDIVSHWKYRGDYVLGTAFQSIFKNVFIRNFPSFKSYTIVPIPLTEERRLIRGFNQAEVLASFLPKASSKLLIRHSSEKQAKKTRKERLSATNPFKQVETVNNPVILVDDIYTTGSTLRHAAQLLKENGCPKVVSFTLIRG
ncbi:ComF family protein [Virgibacillus sp. W0430]|uniref:ComF family protein n=1 Tax=Virgibacillus sp. W0430 TaxID=3391580 RepID=UPI003F478891